MIFLIVMSINLLGDGIRDTLDPRLKSGALSRPASRTQTELPDKESSSDNGSTLLDVRSLRTEFHTGPRILKAVNSVDLQLIPGECLGIVGESGSGKSVTALSLLGLVASPPGKIVSGSVTFDDKDLLRISDRELQVSAWWENLLYFPGSTCHPAPIIPCR